MLASVTLPPLRVSVRPVPVVLAKSTLEALPIEMTELLVVPNVAPPLPTVNEPLKGKLLPV